jgi:uncharacterized MAPEG superfamily protein
MASSLAPLDAFLCLLLLAALAYVPHVLKVAVILRRTGRYSLHNPRETVAKAIEEIGAGAGKDDGAKGAGALADARLVARLQACHENHLEHFPIAAAAVLAAAAAGVDRGTTDAAATALLASRVVHFAAYAVGGASASIVRGLVFVAGCAPSAYLLASASSLRASSKA